MSVLAIQIGDIHLRSAYLDRINAPTAIEDDSETQSFVTPSLVTIDRGGALLGNPALMVAAEAPAATVRWRYRRAALLSRSVVATDDKGLGLTSEAFAAFALRRLAYEAHAWTSDRPQLAIVTPAELAADACLRLSSLAASATGQAVALVDEDRALRAALRIGAKTRLMVVSIDDDATRVRLGSEGGPLLERNHAELGLGALRLSWLERWNADCASLLGGADCFGDGDTPDFERVWQDTWEVLNADPRFKTPIPIWPLVRQSQLLPLTGPRESLRAAVQGHAQAIADAIERPAEAGRSSAAGDFMLVVVGEPALGRALADLLARRWDLPAHCWRTCHSGIYAAGATRLLAASPGLPAPRLDSAPATLGVLGMARDEANLSFRALISAGTALPATATFSVMANRDTQKRLALSLARQSADQAQPVISQRFEFGPLLGQGMQKLKITIQWANDGRVTASATDAESGHGVPCCAWHDIVNGTTLLGAQHLAAFD